MCPIGVLISICGIVLHLTRELAKIIHGAPPPPPPNDPPKLIFIQTPLDVYRRWISFIPRMVCTEL